MKTYLVGGANRNLLMGREPADMDYVIVGATQSDIEGLIGSGYKQVGKDFPVFISPDGNEYALARKERKTASGHRGFVVEASPEVTLIEDLARRDLTINAIAFDLDTLEVIDPFEGQKDIRNKWLRHITEAFCEDPLRVLRIARFNASFGKDWEIHPDTKRLMKNMAYCGELKSLTPNRVWKEMHKALQSENSSIFFIELKDLIFEEVDAMFGIPQPENHHPEIDTYIHMILCLEQADLIKASPLVKFGVLCHDFGKPMVYALRGDLIGHEAAGIPVIEVFCNKYGVPKEYKEFAKIVSKFHTKVHSCLGRLGQGAMKPRSVMKLFEETSAITKPERFKEFLLACMCDAKGRKGFESILYPQKDYLTLCLDSVINVDTKLISSSMLSSGKSGKAIGEAIRIARIDAIRAVSYTFNANKLKTT